jgi:hypothetical protein
LTSGNRGDYPNNQHVDAKNLLTIGITPNGTIGKNMKKITIEGNYTRPNAVFYDTYVKIGRQKYDYDDITDVRSVSAPARLVNGLVQLSLRNGEVLHVTYFLRDVERMREAMQLLMPYVRRNRESEAGSAFLESDLFEKHGRQESKDFSIADEIVKLTHLRDNGDISQEEYDLLKARLIKKA